jgi:hypothetical protein
MKMDKDKDGKINRSEATGRIAKNFDDIDTTDDVFIDTNELFWACYRKNILEHSWFYPWDYLYNKNSQTTAKTRFLEPEIIEQIVDANP